MKLERLFTDFNELGAQGAINLSKVKEYSNLGIKEKFIFNNTFNKRKFHRR